MVVVFFPFSLFFEGKKAENDAIGHATSVFVRSFFFFKRKVHLISRILILMRFFFFFYILYVERNGRAAITFF